MRKRDSRTALLLDHQHGRLYLYSPGVAPTVLFLQGDVPAHVRRIPGNYRTRHTESDRLEHVKDFYNEALTHLEGATEIVLVGPGTAKDELANRISATPRLSNIPLRTYTTAWMDEPGFEQWSRDTLHVPANTPLVFMKGLRERARRRIGSPGTPLEPSRHKRTNELKAHVENVSRQSD